MKDKEKQELAKHLVVFLGVYGLKSLTLIRDFLQNIVNDMNEEIEKFEEEIKDFKN